MTRLPRFQGGSDTRLDVARRKLRYKCALLDPSKERFGDRFARHIKSGRKMGNQRIQVL